jgi:hypothetical protein
MGVLIASSHVGSSRLHPLPGLIVAGVGLGLTFAPLQTIAMPNVEPQMAGAASGMINTTRQLGGVIGAAAVGALLQAQLSSHLKSAALAGADQLAAQYRSQVTEALSHVASGSQDIAGGQISTDLPGRCPRSGASRAERVLHPRLPRGLCRCHARHVVATHRRHGLRGTVCPARPPTEKHRTGDRGIRGDARRNVGIKRSLWLRVQEHFSGISAST